MPKHALSPFNDEAVRKQGLTRGRKVEVYDTTLRDGEQMPGVSFDLKAKVRIAEALADAGVRHIEAGFPAVSEEEVRCVKAVSRLGTGSEILSLCRMRKEDVDACADAEVDFLLMFIASSELHMRYKFGCTREKVVELSTEAMEYAKSRGLRFSFSTEDSTRSELPFLLELNALAERLGAERIGITDTTGCASPEGIAHLVRNVLGNTDKPLSVHLHNDLGLALANALASLREGATFFAATVNGIGERAGNLSLEEFCVASKLVMGAEHGVKLEKMTAMSALVADASGYKVPRNKPVVGRNVFTHESGIHVAAILNNPLTYEPFSPELVGGSRKLVMGKHSGRAFVKKRLADRSVEATNVHVDAILKEVKRLGELNGGVSEPEFWEIVEEVRNGGRN